MNSSEISHSISIAPRDTLHGGWGASTVTTRITSGDVISVREHGPDDTSPSAVVDPLVGVVVADRYRILEPIGRGGMGVVYKVEHLRIGKLLAMKLLAGDLARDPEVVRRFDREARIVSRLTSPNTVQVFDFGMWSGFTYLVMELVQGESLGRLLRRGGPISIRRLGRIAVQICGAHEKGIIHRDIKPDNVMILSAPDGADVVKVLDFGLAKLREVGDGDPEITSQGTILGTPYYMAPEQIRGEEVDARTDVYAVAALMYRMLTGHHLFEGPPMVVMSRQLTEEPMPPEERAPDRGIPAGLGALVMRALHKDPDRRFQSIEALRAEIVRQIREAGSSSFDHLLDPVRLRHLADSAGRGSEGGGERATREDVDAYERRLRRRRFGAVSAAVAVFGFSAGSWLAAAQAPSRFEGVEVEPNDTPAQATRLPLGRKVLGHIGARVDATHGDRDFYVFDVPPDTPGGFGYVHLHLGALPNMAVCALLYRRDLSAPIQRFCSGKPGLDLDIPVLALEPGEHRVAVLQDVDGYGDHSPMVLENVSDTYALEIDRVTPRWDREVEPNDEVRSATPLRVDAPIGAALDSARDVDVFCLDASVTPPVRFHVRPATAAGAAHLEVTVIHGGVEGARSSIDASWRSETVGYLGEQRCLRVRATQPSDALALGYVVEAVSDN